MLNLTITRPTPVNLGVIGQLQSIQIDTFSNTFNNPGTFSYTDQVEGNNGQIEVIQTATPTITLESPRIEGGQFLFEATGLTIGKTNVLLTSTNLTAWNAVNTNLTANTTNPRHDQGCRSWCLRFEW